MLYNVLLYFIFQYAVDTMREIFMIDALDTHQGFPRCIRRDAVYDDVFNMYQRELADIIKEFPFWIEYSNERAVDTGGVCRDMFSCFWEEAYLKHFDGESLLVSAINANSEMLKFPVLGAILAHGFFVCNFLPVRIAFPIIASVLYGPNVNIPDQMLLESLIDFVAWDDGHALRKATSCSATEFEANYKSRLIQIFSNLGCTEIPSPSNIKRLIISTAKYQFIIKPLGIIYTLRSGVPIDYHKFWAQFTIERFFRLY